jgi:NAD(P)-dependent dehydrogenase (short-subunit alcohol dehydrogenase family)
VRLLASRGVQVIAGVRRDEDGSRLVEACGDRVIPVILDVTDQSSIDAAAKRVAEITGGTLDGLVNNAGIGVGGPLEFVPMDQLRRQFEVNTFGPMAVTQSVLPMLRAGRGRIVNISSLAGRLAQPFVGPYCASKHALEALSDALRFELAPWGVGVVVIEPGAVKTPIWDKSLATVDEMTANMPEEARNLYGGVIRRVRGMLQRMGRDGVPPEQVAESVLHALTASQPRTRYAVGRDARALILVQRFTSGGMRDRMIRRMAGLGEGRPAAG